jgi:acetyl-CoA carboxylase biotin carboxyl carrier protein
MDEALHEYLKSLLQLVEDHHLTELCIESAEVKIKIRTNSAEPEVAYAALPLPVAQAAHPAQAPKASKSRPCPPKEKTNGQYHDLRSPLVGVFYRAPAPDAPSFVEPGDVVQAGQVVCIIEAMKVFNEIHADRAGRVVDICAQNGEVVESDQVLMRIDYKNA